MSTYANSDQARLYYVENCGAYLTGSGRWTDKISDARAHKTRAAACKARDARIAKSGSTLIKVVSL